jgi:hypothetical protein
LSANEEQVARAFLAARKGETAIRDAVRAIMSREYGPLWQSQLSDELVTRWKGIQEQEQLAGGPARGQELLEYATIDELAGLINKFWKAFEPHFGNLAATQSRIGDFRSYRNPLMHGAEFTEDECGNLLYITDELTAMCAAEGTPNLGNQSRSVIAVQRAPAAVPLDKRQEDLLSVINRATEEMSGVLQGERDALLDYLQANLDRCSPEALAQVHDRFSTVAGTADVIESVRRMLPPRRPPQPERTKDVSKWLSWAARFYIPYQLWLLRTNRVDREVADMGTQYEDWLYQSYPGLLGKSDSLVVSTYKVVKQQLESRRRVLWLVVDNLSGFWLADFVSALGNAGVQITETRRMLSMLPSVTPISRRSMLAGRLPAEAVAFVSDTEACQKLWSEQGISPIAVCTSAQDAERAVGEQADLIVMIYNRLDSLAHEVDHPGFDREEEMILAMRNLATKTGNILRKMQSVRPARLIVSTDHGATWPGPDSKVVNISSSAVDDRDVDNHRRFFRVQDTNALNEVDWFVLREQEYGLPATYAAVRGQRFIGSRPKAFTHGGLSPEETVVTLLIGDVEGRLDMELVLAQATPPLRLGRPGSIAILVRNPFEVPVEDLQLSIPALGIRFEPLDIAAGSEAITTEQNITLPAKLDVDDGAAFVRMSGNYQISGRNATISQRVELKVRVLYQTSINDLEDMLDVRH